MPTKRLTMRKIREILRLRFDCKLTYGEIATSCGIGRTTVSDYLNRFEASPLGWPLPSESLFAITGIRIPEHVSHILF